MNNEMKKNAGWKPYIALSIFTFILYTNTLNHFFALDDGVVLMQNKFTQQGIKGIPDIFKYDTFIGSDLWLLNHYDETITAGQLQEGMEFLVGGRYRPLSVATFALEVELFGKINKYPNSSGEFIKVNFFVSHLVNILLYLSTGCLLFLILHRLFSSGKDIKWFLSFPFIVSVLFLAHPIHTEAVANIKGRDEIMTLLGSLAALWFTIKYFDTHKIYHLGLSGLCLFLGLLSKENAITFLAVIPITIYYFVDRKPRKILKSMFPLVIASGIFLLIRASILGITVNASEVSELMNNPFLYATKSETLATVFYTLLLYVKLLFFPHPLTWDYYPYHIEIVNWTNPVTILSLLFYLGITVYAVYGLFKKKDVISYSIWFYLLPLTVVSNLFFPVGVFMSERFIFISSIGFCIFIGCLIYKYLPKITKTIKGTSYLTSIIMIIILCLFSVKTISRNRTWKNDFTLFETDIKTSKNSAKGNYMLGYDLSRKAAFPDSKEEFLRKGEFCEEAVRHLKRAIELHPKYAEAIESLASLYFDCYCDVSKSLHYYAIGLQYSAIGNAIIYNAVKVVLNQIPRLLNENLTSSTPEEIIQSCDELLKVRPDIGEAYYIKGLIYGRYLNEPELSLANFEMALSLDFPKSARFYEDIGVAYAISIQYEEALYYMLKAVESGTDDPATYTNLGFIYQQLGDMDNASLYTTKGNEMKKRIENNE